MGKGALKEELVEIDVLCIGGKIAVLMVASRVRERGAKVIVAVIKVNVRAGGKSQQPVETQPFIITLLKYLHLLQSFDHTCSQKPQTLSRLQYPLGHQGQPSYRRGQTLQRSEQTRGHRFHPQG